MSKFFSAILVLLLVSACVKLPDGADRNARLVQLHMAEILQKTEAESQTTILIDLMEAEAPLNTDRIAVLTLPYEQDYYADVKWAERAPQMTRTLIKDYLTEGSGVKILSHDAYALNPNYLLRLDLLDFQAEYKDAAHLTLPVVHIRLKASLVKMPERTIVAAEVIEEKVNAKANKMNDVIAAFDEGFQKVQMMLAKWVENTLK